MAGSLPPPGVTITIEPQTNNPTIATPMLSACIIGPCKQIMDPTNSDGTINEDAKAGSYDGTAALFEFPNLEEDSDGNVVSSVIANSVRVYLRYGNNDLETALTEDEDYTVDVDTGVTIVSGVDGVASPVKVGVYIYYEGLRMDVAPYSNTNLVGTKTGVTIETMDDIETYLGLIDVRNPMAIAAWMHKQNAPNTSLVALGVDEVSPTAPDGTADAYTRSLEASELLDVYCMVPLSQETSVLSQFKTHVDSMSLPESKKERICFLNPIMPVNAADETLVSGSFGSRVDAYTFNTSVDLTDEDIAVGDELHISSSETVFTITSVATGSDYEVTVEEALPSAVDIEWYIAHPGDPLTTRADVAAAYAAIGESYNDSRVYLLVPDTIEISVDGIIQEVEGFYACAAVAGQIGELKPQQPLTNYPLSGIIGLDGSNDYFTPTNLNIMAGGGLYIIVQEGNNTLPRCRHQLSTAVATIETRELSIIKSVDYFAKMMRIALQPVLGIHVITDRFINTRVSPIMTGISAYLVQEGVVNSAELLSIGQDTTSPDTIDSEIDVGPAYPCNNIKVKLLI